MRTSRCDRRWESQVGQHFHPQGVVRSEEGGPPPSGRRCARRAPAGGGHGAEGQRSASDRDPVHTARTPGAQEGPRSRLGRSGCGAVRARLPLGGSEQVAAGATAGSHQSEFFSLMMSKLKFFNGNPNIQQRKKWKQQYKICSHSKAIHRYRCHEDLELRARDLGHRFASSARLQAFAVTACRGSGPDHLLLSPWSLVSPRVVGTGQVRPTSEMLRMIRTQSLCQQPLHGLSLGTTCVTTGKSPTARPQITSPLAVQIALPSWAPRMWLQ